MGMPARTRGGISQSQQQRHLGGWRESSSSVSYVPPPCMQTGRMAGRIRDTAAARRGMRVVRRCGIVGVVAGHPQASLEVYEALMMLQHRGQDTAGIATLTADGLRQRVKSKKARGLVREVFPKEELERLRGHIGLGHVRYPTAGADSADEAQPFFVNSPLGIWLIHNGNLTNAEDLRSKLERSSQSSYRRFLRTESDSEVLLNVLADEVHRAYDRVGGAEKTTELLFEGARGAMRKLKGAYSVVSIVAGVGLLAMRDPNGIRPLSLGRRESQHGAEWCVSSETSAFGPLGYTLVRDVAPGECVIISEFGEMESRIVSDATPQMSPCLFEYIYLARPDSVMNGINVYEMQLELGRRLAERIASEPYDIDVVVPVPDGSRPAAIEIANRLGLPYREGLVKNRYVGRTFIMPDQRMREFSVRRKLNAMRSVFEGQRVLLVDDSIVRGTTMRQIVTMVRQAGADKVYLASASPPVRFPNVYGVDIPSRDELVASDRSVQDVCAHLNADWLIYQTIDDLIGAGKSLNPEISRFDASCFDGDYVTEDVDSAYLEALATIGRGRKKKSHAPEENASPDILRTAFDESVKSNGQLKAPLA